MSCSNHGRAITYLLLILGVVAGSATTLGAQDTGLTIDFGGDARSTAPEVIPDSVLDRALAIFNAPGTSRYFGGSQLRSEIGGAVGVYNADVLISGHVRGDVVVVNGDLRLERGATVDGRIIVLGGRFSPDTGTTWNTPVEEYREVAQVRLTSSTTLVRAATTTTLADLTRRMAVQFGDIQLTPRLDIGVYNRVEGLPIGIGPTLRWHDGQRLAVRADGELIVRTAKDPAGVRSTTGWWGRLQATREGPQALTVGVEAGDRIIPTADAVLSATESSLNSVLFRRDYRDWFAAKGISGTIDWAPLSLIDVALRVSRVTHRSVAATSPFSFLREDNPWRANPLMDDGKYTIIGFKTMLTSAREDETRQQGWRVELGVLRTSGSEITQALLPELIRGALPATDYQSWEASFDIRRIQRLDPRNAIHLRLAGQGWVAGDPMTIQRRIALNGAEPFPGYSFRAVNCDIRRRPDPAAPSLCDRRVMIQGELRRTVDLNLGTGVGPYGLGIDRADLIVFGDFGSAWLSGDGPGRVPANKIQSLGEWRGDLGVGIDAGWVGAYLAKSITDDEPLRLSFRLRQRF